MAFINFQPKDYFNTKLWTGTGAENAITGVGFQPDWVWIKNRDAAEHNKLYDAVRGANKVIYSNLTNAEATVTQDVKSFDSDGFTLGTESAVNASGQNIVGWNWRASGTSGSSNTDGSITSTVSANTTSGFSIVKYTGTGANATVGHGLGAVPKFIIVKALNDPRSWITYNSTNGATGGIDLNSTGAFNTNSTLWNNTSPTSSVVHLGTSVQSNSTYDYIMYCFADVKGFSKVSGSYVGNGSTDGSFIYTGMKPAFVLIKCSSAIGDWQLIDSTRSTFNVCNLRLQPNSSGAEAGSDTIDICSNGFKQRNTFGNFNTSGATYIYMCFAESPLVSSNGVPATAR